MSVSRMVRPEEMLLRVPEVWYSFKVTKSSLNGVKMCEAQVLKCRLTCFTVSIGVELSTIALHVSEPGVSLE